MTTFSMGTAHELAFYQLQQQAQELLKQSQNAILAAQLQLSRSQTLNNQPQSLPMTPSTSTSKQPAQRSLSDISAYYLTSNQRALESQSPCSPLGLSASVQSRIQRPSQQQLVLAQLPQPPCVSLQSRDSVKSESSLQCNESATRYKTEMCRPFEETGHCRYGSKCQFAHGIRELRGLNRHPRYKTEFCRTFHTTGFCSYGQRCNFIHNEDERRPVKASPMTNSRPQALQINKHLPLTVTSSGGSSPASSVYDDMSPTHSPSYLSEDPFTTSTGPRMSPTPSLSSFSSDISGSVSFPSPPGTPLHSDDLLSDAKLISSPLDFGLTLAFMNRLNFRQ